MIEATRNWGLIYEWLEEILDDVALAHPLKVNGFVVYFLAVEMGEGQDLMNML